MSHGAQIAARPRLAPRLFSGPCKSAPVAIEEAAQSEISSAKPDMLFVGISTPKKEIFLETWGAKLDVAVCHGVGGSFDVLAGKTRRAPELWQKLGIEWLWRLLQEPRRMWKRYLVTNTLFMTLIVKEWSRARWSKSPIPR